MYCRQVDLLYYLDLPQVELATELAQGDLYHLVKEVVVEFEELLVELDLTEGSVEDTQDEEDARKVYSQKGVLSMSSAGLLRAMVSMMLVDSKVEDMLGKV